MTKLSDRSETLLKSAGWREGRSIDITSLVRHLESKGYSVFPFVVAFLKEFGGLKIQNPSAKPPAAKNWHFDVVEASRRTSLERIKRLYIPRVQSDLCIIGESEDEYVTLMMDKKGQVFGGFEDHLVFLGKSGHAAINQLASEKYARPVGQ